MKRNIFLTLLLCLLSVLTSSAKTDFKTDNINYTILTDREGCVEVAADYSALYSVPEITVPSTVTNEDDGKTYTVVGIANSAFANTGGALTKIHLPETIEYIGKTAFSGATGFKSFELPKGLKQLGANAFNGCTNISEFTVAEGNEYFSANDGVLFDKTQSTLLAYPLGKAATSYTIPDGVKEIAEKVFTKANKLTTIIADKDLSVIGASAFYSCANLTTVDLSACNITSVATSAFASSKKIQELNFAGSSFEEVAPKMFYGCVGLKKLWLPATASKIGTQAFKNLSAIEELHMHATAPAQFEGNGETCAMFFNKDVTTLYVPTGSKAAYEADAAYAGAFKDIVEEQVSGAEDNLSMEFAYCTDKIATSVGESGKELHFKAAIQIPADKAKTLAGNKVTQVKLGTYSTVCSNTKVFLTYDLNSEPFYTQDVVLKKNTWNVIELNTPYVIEGKEFFVGYSTDSISTYSRRVLPYAIDNSEKANPLGDWVSVRKSADAPESWEHLGASNFTNLCIKMQVEGSNLPRYDVSLASTSIKKVVKPGEEFSVSGSVKNMAAKPFKKITVNYTFDGGEPTSVDLESDEEVAQKETFSFYIPGLSLTEEGMHDFSLSIAAIDGNADETPSDNAYTTQIKCTSKVFDRKVLIENFTTAACGNCPRVHKYIEEVMKSDPNVICVAHHAGYSTDKFTIKASEEYLYFYNGTTSAPTVMLDRTYFPGLGIYDRVTPVINPSSEEYLRALVNAREDEPAYVTVNVENDYNPDTRELKITVKGKKSEETPGNPSLCMSVCLTEDGLVAYQSGSGGGKDYVHDHVVRAWLTPLTCDPITFDDDNNYVATYTTTLDKEWIAKNMKTVAFVSEFSSKDVTGCQIYNANDAIVTDKEETGINAANSAADAVAISTTGNTVHVDGAFDSVAVYSLAGNLIASTGNADTTLPQGIYMVKVNAKGNVKTAKVVIK